MKEVNNKPMDQDIEATNRHTGVNCSFTKEQKECNRAKIVSLTNAVGKNGHSHAKKKGNLDTDHTKLTKYNSK